MEDSYSLTVENVNDNMESTCSKSNTVSEYGK